jgi:hypothetical protein
LEPISPVGPVGPICAWAAGSESVISATIPSTQRIARRAGLRGEFVFDVGFIFLMLGEKSKSLISWFWFWLVIVMVYCFWLSSGWLKSEMLDQGRR